MTMKQQPSLPDISYEKEKILAFLSDKATYMHVHGIEKHDSLSEKEEQSLWDKVCSFHALREQETEESVLSKPRDVVLREGLEAYRSLGIANLHLVISITGGYKKRNKNISMPKSLLKGVEGLCGAIDNFVPESGIAFPIHASWWIKQSIIRDFTTAFHAD